MRCVQQTLLCSDFDLTFPDRAGPACRVLLPEHVSADDVEFLGVVHVVPGTWAAAGEGVMGTFRIGSAVEVGVWIADGGTEALVELCFGNLLDRPLKHAETNICAALNHIPGDCGFHWSNREFIPEAVPLDRDAQGRYWYGQLSPTNYKALTAGGWVGLHPSPDDPDPDRVEPYVRDIGTSADATACAAKAPDKDLLFYQAWSVLCRRQAPFKGNACMHLQPVLGEIGPGQSATIRGRIGFHEGTWDTLAALLK